MFKKKVQKDKQRSIKHTHKNKDRVTRTPIKTEDELRCSKFWSRERSNTAFAKSINNISISENILPANQHQYLFIVIQHNYVRTTSLGISYNFLIWILDVLYSYQNETNKIFRIFYLYCIVAQLYLLIAYAIGLV